MALPASTKICAGRVQEHGSPVPAAVGGATGMTLQGFVPGTQTPAGIDTAQSRITMHGDPRMFDFRFRREIIC